ncbi:hypothetical protein [Ralstonia solanacearum]|uniref:hypothetical protein n=1 Tax=Ralstonia solanacearum TaxID=305 RepID=UPI002E1E7900
MTKRRALLAGACAVVAGLAAWFALQVHQDPGGVPTPQVEAGRPATRPEIPANPGHPGRARPLVAVVGHNANTELTDFVVPYGVLKRADVADVVAGPSNCFPRFASSRIPPLPPSTRAFPTARTTWWCPPCTKTTIRIC